MSNRTSQKLLLKVNLWMDALRFTQFYNTGRCCPTRASLLTGLYSHEAGIGGMVGDQGVPGYRGQLNDSCVTLAEVLGSAGYFTAISGKWHVGQPDARRAVLRESRRWHHEPPGCGDFQACAVTIWDLKIPCQPTMRYSTYACAVWTSPQSLF
ncbi:MAG: sulfatase-like hydrolase/transferase [Opitutaceae bacterium]|nr:sulfatase-like hydrolase/transferase [Opitutaceae bacterium]